MGGGGHVFTIMVSRKASHGTLVPTRFLQVESASGSTPASSEAHPN